jgi:hypothetical protein
MFLTVLADATTFAAISAVSGSAPQNPSDLANRHRRAKTSQVFNKPRHLKICARSNILE